MGALGASCFQTLSDESRDIPKAEWDEERFGMVCTKAENFADWKAAILKMCKYSKNCTWQDKQMIRAFAARMEQLQLRALR